MPLLGVLNDNFQVLGLEGQVLGLVPKSLLLAVFKPKGRRTGVEKGMGEIGVEE